MCVEEISSDFGNLEILMRFGRVNGNSVRGCAGNCLCQIVAYLTLSMTLSTPKDSSHASSFNVLPKVTVAVEPVCGTDARMD